MFRASLEKLIFRWNKIPLIVRLVIVGVLIVTFYNWKPSFKLQEHYPFCPSYTVLPVSYKENIIENGSRVVMNPPFFIPRKYQHQLNAIEESIRTKEKNRPLRNKILNIVSEIVQEQLKSLQNPEDCNKPNILCGHHDECGLGCQIHHRILCLEASYALGMPLIHNQNHWSYSKTWDNVFIPLGSPCKPGDKTYELQWIENVTLTKLNGEQDKIEFPLKHGFVAMYNLADIVESSHTFPFLWWFGQFLKFGVQLNERQQKRLEKAKQKLKFHHPVIGVHVRRTDKSVLEGDKTSHPISKYAEKVKYVYKHKFKDSLRKNVFVASDDADVLDETKQVFKKDEGWNIIGFENRRTYQNQSSRLKALNEIVLDLHLLAECDFIVCGFSSNICRLLLGMLNYRHYDGMNRLDGSLDGNYVPVFSRRIPTDIHKVCK